MNYRHHFHAGNQADVFKHALLLRLFRAMQRKEKGFLFLDTHAGRGAYDLTEQPVLPGGRTRAPEHPGGIGRLWGAAALPQAITDYVGLVRTYNEQRGVAPGELHYYPGSPCLAQLLARPQDRLVLCELQEADAEALAYEFGRNQRVTVRTGDGYNALKALLPPPEKRALVLVDPPFEEPQEFAAILAGLRAALARFPSGVYTVWYPLTGRAGVEGFMRELAALRLPPTLAVELQVAADSAAGPMKGCGLLVLNPPWKVEDDFQTVLPALAGLLKIDASATVRCTWLVPES
jgi:23S rRNA (adenine2030-N6)-methyltransferase